MHRNCPLGEVPEMEVVRELPGDALLISRCLRPFDFESVARELKRR